MVVLKGVGPRCEISITITQHFSQAKLVNRKWHCKQEINKTLVSSLNTLSSLVIDNVSVHVECNSSISYWSHYFVTYSSSTLDRFPSQSRRETEAGTQTRNTHSLCSREKHLLFN